MTGTMEPATKTGEDDGDDASAGVMFAQYFPTL